MAEKRRVRPSDNPPEMPPARDLGAGNRSCGAGDHDGDPLARIVAAGARKEKLRQRSWKPSAGRSAPRPYAELRAASAFSFLDGSSLPEDLIEEAARQELPAVALVDRNGVYGAPRFYKAAREAGLKALVGAEVTLREPPHPERERRRGDGRSRTGSREKVPPADAPLTSVSPPEGRGCPPASHAPRRKPRRLQEPLPSHHRRRAREGEGRDGRLARGRRGARRRPRLPDRGRRGPGRARRSRREASTRPGNRSGVSPRSFRAACTSSSSATACAGRSTATRRSPIWRGACASRCGHQRRALRPREGQGAARRPDGDPRPHDARRRGKPARGASASGTSRARAKWRRSFRICPRRSRAPSSCRSGSTSRWRTSGTASPIFRCRPARRRPRTCAGSPGTARARASGR